MGYTTVSPGLAIVDLAYSDTGELLGTYREYFLADSTRIVFSWEKKAPARWNPLDLTEINAMVWALWPNGAPVKKTPHFADWTLKKLAPTSKGFYTFDPILPKMVAIIAPYGHPLLDADPKPRGVWEANGRMCAFWPVSKRGRKIHFKLGGPVKSLTKIVRQWRDRIEQPPRRWTCRIVFALLSALVISLFVTLALVFGQAAAAAWIGAVGTVAGVAITWIFSKPLTYKGRIDGYFYSD